MNFRVLLPIVWAGIILILCSVPGKDIPTAGWMQMVSLDKWVHFFIFVVQMIFVMRAVDARNSPEQRSISHWIWFVAVVAYGGLTELYQQYFLTDRQADIYDFVANAAGATAGWLIYERYFSGHKRNNTYQKTF